MIASAVALLMVGACYQVDPFATDDDDDMGPAGDDDDASGDDDDDASGDDDDDASDDDDGFPPAPEVEETSSLPGRVYSLDLAGATFVEPPGAGGLLSTLLSDEYLLFSVGEGSDFSAGGQPGLQMFGAAGSADDDGNVLQGLCNESLNLTAGADEAFDTSDDTPAEWLDPWLDLGPIDLALEISGEASTLTDVTISGRFEPDLSAFVDGRLHASMDSRPLDETLGGGEGAACDFVEEAYGVACHECGAPDPGPFCITVVAEQITGAYLDGVVLQPRSCADIIWSNIAAGTCQSAADDYDPAGDGSFTGCPEFDG
ncbi:MAG: hypothetical protein GY898_34280 [Proteobacteria bacterium]|nr:hypothetical protein [Pseudomonadota bacterium]